MTNPVPAAAEVRATLAALSHQQVQLLADWSAVPVHTLLKIRNGETKNPGLDTVRAFLPHIKAAQRGRAPPRPDPETAAAVPPLKPAPVGAMEGTPAS